MGPTHLKIISKALKEEGVKAEEMPELLQDTVVHRSRKGPVGAIEVRKLSGIRPSPPSRMMIQFEKNVGGREEVIEKLEAFAPELGEKELRLLDLLKTSNKTKGLARLVAEAGVEPTKVIDAYARACVYLGKAEAAIEAHKNLPMVVKDLVAHAIDKEGFCGTCIGSGKVKARAGAAKDTQSCPLCGGSGRGLSSSKHKEFAVQKLLEITKLTGPQGSPTINVQQNLGVSVGGAGFMEKQMAMADEILYRRGPAVDAEFTDVQPEDHSNQSS